MKKNDKNDEELSMTKSKVSEDDFFKFYKKP